MEEVNEEKTLCSENTKEYSICIISYIYGNIYNFNTSVSTNDKILTLSTCKDNYGKRVVVHAKLEKE